MEGVKIIAEAGVNHNGSLEKAIELIDVACSVGADAIKFQTFRAEAIATKDARKADYQIRNTMDKNSQYEMLKKLELGYEDFVKLYSYCNMKKIAFLSSPFDLKSVAFLYELGVKEFKIPSGEITDYPYLKKIASYKKPILLSTGMAEVEEIKEALTVLEPNEITLLHCTSDYPAPMNEVNLKAMVTLGQIFDKKVGYSDHTMGIEAAIGAVALGACVIEKHFTLDKHLPGPDHSMSLEPKEFKELVLAIRNMEAALGDGEKRPVASEKKNKEAVRKSLVASRDIMTGEIFTEYNIETKRPGNGISPMQYEKLLGKEATRNYKKDELIMERML